MKLKTILNYFGQLRIYSYIDLFIFCLVMNQGPKVIIGILLLWLGFLLYLEGQHKDELRLGINQFLWLGPIIITLFLLPLQTVLLFCLFSFLYTKKKKIPLLGQTSSLWRAAQNTSLVLFLRPELSLLTFLIVYFRNLIGDFRDAGTDAKRSINTLPVVLNFKKDYVWAFYGHLILVLTTTYIWLQLSTLPHWLIIPIWLVQIISYPLTPRLSNPDYLNIYK